MRCYVDMLLITSTANIKTWERDNGLYGGLSPLARGTHIQQTFRMHSGRFIPAGAGNSIFATPARTSTPVYPRWRGELAVCLQPSPGYFGLSPLARGTLVHSRNVWARWRFIPAGAGNSLNLMMAVTAWTVYPRWRGELCKHNLLLINDFLSQSQSTNFTVSHKQHIHYVKEYLIDRKSTRLNSSHPK